MPWAMSLGNDARPAGAQYAWKMGSSSSAVAISCSRAVQVYDLEVLPHRLRSSLFVAQMVGAATLIRSIMFDRWITVLVSLLLIGGASAAIRGRTWGIALSLAAAAWFHVAAAIGIAPPWFILVGMLATMPFMHVVRPMARFDGKATAVLGLIAAALGAAGAIGWKLGFVTIVTQIPQLRPSFHANHGLLLALLGTVVFANRARLVGGWEPPGARAGAARVRVAEDDATSVARAGEDALVDDHDAEHEGDFDPSSAALPSRSVQLRR